MAEPTFPAPIVRAFRIRGLHGYKDIEVDFRGPARIAIAENGTGKTTILSALYAFLTGDFERLRNLSFDSVECDFAGEQEPLVLRREQITKQEPTKEGRINELARYTDLDPAELRRIILSLESLDYRVVMEETALRDIHQRSPYSAEDIVSVCREFRAQWEASRPQHLKSLAAAVKAKIHPCAVLYLPTYRRVELSLGRRNAERSVTRRQNASRYGQRQRSTRMGDIRFGLADVEDRLQDLAGEIQGQTNFGYRQISANIIDELLTTGLPYDEVTAAALPDIDALALFLSRIESRVAPEQRLDSIRDLYGAGKHSTMSAQMLRYFLSKLSKVVDQTKVLEANIETFVEKANVYLLQSSEEKRLQYDARLMRVVVQSQWTKGDVALEDLSSGEKQVVSLLAHFYLYPEKKIVLIDEPELSLSIDWQRRLLPDVLSSPTCVQLLAITHSPFIFDNELDPYAGPIRITRKEI